MAVRIGVGAGPVLIADRAVTSVSWVSGGLLLLYPDRPRSATRTFLLSRIEHGTVAAVAGFLGGRSPEVSELMT